MATRRDELSAHSFARKRTLAAFLQPESRVSDEEAPRPVRAIVPSVVTGVILVAGCIAWGAIAPSAPKGWDTAGEHIIVDTKSTTRYVVLEPKNKSGKKIKQLHPVMNFASAKLVLDKGKGEVIEVDGEHIDKSGIARGATIGIPYAPDRLPDAKDAETRKEWAVCEKPSANGEGDPQQGVFVLGGADKKSLKDKNRLTDGEGLYVQDSETEEQFVVDGNGTKLPLGPEEYGDADRALLARVVMQNPGELEPQQVSSQWLRTLNEGDPLQFPQLAGTPGDVPSFSGVSALPEESRMVGMIVQVKGVNSQHYVVGDGGLQAVSPLVAKLFMGSSQIPGGQKPVEVGARDVAETGANAKPLKGGKGWPDDVLERVNLPQQGIDDSDRLVSCSVYTGKSENGRPKLAAWAGREYPENIVAGSASAYVSSGSGLLFREVSGSSKGGGSQFLLTDSGLRYAMAGGSQGAQQGGSQEEGAKARLGYEKSKVVTVPQAWSSLLPKGPSLDTESASQEQGM